MAEPALWRVNGEKGTLYLFGTVHILPEETDWLSPEVKEIFDQSDNVVLEVVSSQTEEDALSLLAQNTEVFRSSIPLQRRLEADLYTALLARMESFGVIEAQLNRYQPWYAAVVLARLGNEEAGFFNWFGVDTALQTRAEEQDQKLISLETSSQQVQFFANLPQETQIRFLGRAVENSKNKDGRLMTQLVAWIAGDIETTEHLVLDPLKANPPMYQVLITNRNIAWLEPLEDLLNKKGVHFVAVGTGHLVGPDGLIKLFEEKGYRVVRE